MAKFELPEGGYERREFGVWVPSERRVMSTGWASAVATHGRTVVTWCIEGEPNDNWPRYIGPWRPLVDIEGASQ